VSRQQAQHSAVVSNSGENGTVRAASALRSNRSRHAANLGNQRFFGKRHRRNQYKPRRDKTGAQAR
jgi:hypothetical protein